jgi:hypothetical protein
MNEEMIFMMLAVGILFYVLPKIGPQWLREFFESSNSRFIEKHVERHISNTKWIREKIDSDNYVNDDDFRVIVRSAVNLAFELQKATIIFLLIPVIYTVYPIIIGPNPARGQDLALGVVGVTILVGFLWLLRLVAIRIRIGQLVRNVQL